MLQCDTIDRPGRAQLRRNHLLDTARTLFTEKGFHQTGMAQIAAASGIKVGQIYRDFESKEAIIAAIAEADITSWLEEDFLAAAVANHDVMAIRDWIRRFLDCDESDDECQMMTEILAESGRNPRIAEILRDIDQRISSSLSSALEALADDPELDEPVKLLIEFMMAATAGVMVRRTINPQTPVKALSQFISKIMDHKLDWLTR